MGGFYRPPDPPEDDPNEDESGFYHNSFMGYEKIQPKGINPEQNTFKIDN